MTGEILHPRREIRDALFLILKNSIKDVKSFSKNRFRPYWQDEELPAISIYTLSESAVLFDSAPRSLKRVLNIAVEIIAQDTEDVDDLIDKLCLDVENAVHVDETLKGKASDCVLATTEMIQKKEGETLTASAVLGFDVTYYAYAPDTQKLKDFTGADFTVEVGGDGTPVQETEVDVDT